LRRASGFWQREFGGDSAIMGKPVLLNGHSFPVIGVTPANFFGMEVGRNFDVIVPACTERLISGAADSHILHRDHWWLAIVGRLKPGWTLSQALAQVKAISPAVFENSVPQIYRPDQVGFYRKYQLTAQLAGSGISSLRDQIDRPLLILSGIAGLVLLIACANLANLTLARASAREREMAVRLAIGAGRSRLIRQLLSESLLLTFFGTLLGVLLANLLARYMVNFITTNRDPVFLALTPDWRLLAFTASVAVLTCVLFGLTPAIRATRTAPASAMKAGGRGLTADREHFGLRRGLVVAQVAMSLVLLAGALLFVRSLRNLTTLDAGLQQDGLMIMGADITRLEYAPGRRAAVYRELIEKVRAIPGVELAATTNIVPISGNGWNNFVQIVELNKHERMIPWFNRVGEIYFKTMGTPLLAGRDFGPHDNVSSQQVAVVNQEFSRKFLQGANPVGKHVRVVVGPGEPEQIYQVVGLVKDSKYSSLREDFKPVIFLAQEQEKEPGKGINLLIRSHLPAGTLTKALQNAVARTNPEISISFESFENQVRESLMKERLMATLSGFFGCLAAMLTTIGLYGVISYMVARRRGEIGIRMALGATRSGVLRLILKEAGVLVAIGLVVGAAMAIAAGRSAGSLLYGLQASDPATLAVAVLLLASVAMVASFIPAHRASRTEPMIALREE
jgi:putative ABC transport system permease protein